VNPNSRALPRVPNGNGDFDRVVEGWVGKQVPERAGASVADDRALAAREDRRLLARMGRGDRTDRVDPSVERSKPPGLDKVVNRVRAEAGIAELGTGDDAVLSPSELIDRRDRAAWRRQLDKLGTSGPRLKS
jgi:hypothetical protein